MIPGLVLCFVVRELERGSRAALPAVEDVKSASRDAISATTCTALSYKVVSHERIYNRHVRKTDERVESPLPIALPYIVSI